MSPPEGTCMTQYIILRGMMEYVTSCGLSSSVLFLCIFFLFFLIALSLSSAVLTRYNSNIPELYTYIHIHITLI